MQIEVFRNEVYSYLKLIVTRTKQYDGLIDG